MKRVEKYNMAKKKIKYLVTLADMAIPKNKKIRKRMDEIIKILAQENPMLNDIPFTNMKRKGDTKMAKKKIVKKAVKKADKDSKKMAKKELKMKK